MAPRVSVVIPTCNRAPVLPRAIESVLAQTERRFELIVVDDGSTDDTAQVRAASVDSRVVWVGGPHVGVSAARNRGVESARGEWLAFLDDDNDWRPGYLERQLAVGDRSGADAVACLAVETGSGGADREQPEAPAADLLSASTHGWYPFTSCVLVRRSAFLAAGGFPVDLSHREDWYLWLRIALDGRWALTDDRLMVRHRDGGPRLSDDLAATLAATAEIDRAYHAAVRERLGRRAERRWFWENRGRDHFRAMLAKTEWDGRRAAFASLVALATALPRSASSLWRPFVVMVAGRNLYVRGRDRYHRRHRSVADRRRT